LIVVIELYKIVSLFK